MTVKSQIQNTHAECERLNPHFSTAEACSWVFQRVFGEYKGTEHDKRNMALCK